MPVRLPRARTSEVVSFGFAGIAGFAPLYLMMAPGAGEQMARQTMHWAPRWEHIAANYVTPHAQHVVRHHITPPVERTMQHVERVANPHMSRYAQKAHNSIRNSVDKLSK